MKAEGRRKYRVVLVLRIPFCLHPSTFAVPLTPALSPEYRREGVGRADIRQLTVY
jgi:hypothetical protein